MKNMRQGILSGLVLGFVVAGLLAVSLAQTRPARKKQYVAKHEWNARVSYTETGSETSDLGYKRSYTKQISATYRLITPLVGIFTEQSDGIDWEAVLASGAGGPGFTWEDANISYSDRGQQISERRCDACDYKWSVSDGISLKSEKAYMEQVMRLRDPKQDRDLKKVRLPGFSIYGASTASVGKYMLPVLGISVEAFHPGAMTAQCFGWKCEPRPETTSDLTVAIKGEVPQEKPAAPKGQPATKEQLEKQIMDQIKAAMEGKMPLSEVGRQPWMVELPGKVVQGKREWTNRQPDGKYETTHTLTWEFSLVDSEGIKILKPEHETQHLFKKGKLVIEAEAKVEPPKYAKEVEWEVEDIQGSITTIKPAKGAKVTITFDKLPEKNDQFGPRKITAKVRGQQDQVTIKVFFEREGKDNPGGKEPNWFYYWRQGAAPGLERFAYKPHVPHGYGEHDIQGRTLVVGPRASGVMTETTISLTGKCKGQSITVPRTEGVDTAARVVAHELEHERLFKSKKQDRDGDSVDDREEDSPGHCLDKLNRNTHELSAQMLGVTDPNEAAKANTVLNAAGDNEFLAIAAELKAKADKAKDWACPGKQCKEGKYLQDG